MAILYVGIDLAKNVFARHGVNEAGKTGLVRPAVPREQLKAAVAALPPCVMSMQACLGAHHWARESVDGLARGDKREGSGVANGLNGEIDVELRPIEMIRRRMLNVR